MSQWKLPVIDSKKQLGDDQQYNFVNKDKKKPKEQTSTLSLVEELKRKIQDQKKEIQNRNATIMGLQRNFESLSGIVKHEKAQSAALKAELQKLRENSETGDKRAAQFHQKLIIMQNENKALKQQLSTTKRAHSQCQKHISQAQSYKTKITQLEQIVQKYSSKLDSINQQKKNLQADLLKLKGQDKAKRQLQQRIVDLQEQLKKTMDTNNILNDRLKMQEHQISEARTGTSNKDSKISQLVGQIKQEHQRRKQTEMEGDTLRRKLAEQERKWNEMQKSMESMDVYSKMRQEQEDKLREQLKEGKAKCEQYKDKIVSMSQIITEGERECNKRGEMIGFLEKQLEKLKLQLSHSEQKFANKQRYYLSEMEKLSQTAQQLNSQLDDTSHKNKLLATKLEAEQNEKLTSHQQMGRLKSELDQLGSKMTKQQKYAHYYKLIDMNESKGVVVTNNEELTRMQSSSSSLMAKLSETISENQKIIEGLTQDSSDLKKYISSLELQMSDSLKQLGIKAKAIQEYQEKLQLLQNEQRNLAKTIAEQRKKTEQFKRQSELMKNLSLKEIQQQRQRSQKIIQEQKQKSQRYEAMVKQYQAEEEKIKRVMSAEQQQIRRQTKAKEDEINELIRQKQQEIEKERKNNKLLWTDNKKLKEMEQKMREQAEIQIEQIENKKRQEIQKLKKQLQRRYDEQLHLKRQEESNSSELKKILLEKAEQIKKITQNQIKLKNQVQFYKNRNKQLEGVVSRTQKAFKDQLVTFQKEVKTNKQVISVLQKKNTEINLLKQELEKKYKSDNEKLAQQVSYLKQRIEGQKIQQKVALLNKSIQQFEMCVKAIGNTLSCNYCLEPAKQCVRLKECGHLYCKKCKGGYQPNCGQCKIASVEIPDRMIDETVSKADYMRIIISTVKQDLSKISA